MRSSLLHLILFVLLVFCFAPLSAFHEGPNTPWRARGLFLAIRQKSCTTIKAETGSAVSHLVLHGASLRLRGGGSVRSFMEKSCYPLHGEADTEGDDVGEQEDPYSVAHVAAKPMGPAADPIEQAFIEDLEEDPNDVETLASFANFLMTVRGDAQRAAEMVYRASQINPHHWWIQKYASKYLPPHMVPPHHPAPREAYHQVEEPPPPEVPDDVPDTELSFLQLMVREQQKLVRSQQEKVAQGLEVEPPPLTVHPGESMGDGQASDRRGWERDILLDTVGGGKPDPEPDYDSGMDTVGGGQPDLDPEPEPEYASPSHAAPYGM